MLDVDGEELEFPHVVVLLFIHLWTTSASAFQLSGALSWPDVSQLVFDLHALLLQPPYLHFGVLHQSQAEGSEAVIDRIPHSAS